MIIDNINNYLQDNYYTNIKNYLQKNNINNDYINKHIKNIKYNEIISKSSSESNIMVESLQPIHYKDFDNNVYKKVWSKLNIIHKIIKIKEFIESLNITSITEKNELTNELIYLIRTNKIKNNENLTYDENNGKIKSLSNLQFDNDRYYIIK